MKHTLKIFLAISLGFIAHSSHAQKKQGQPLIDSLLQELPWQKEDTNKVNLLSDLSKIYYSINPDEGIKYGQQDSALAAKLDWKKGIAKADNLLGLNYGNKSDYPKALEYYLKALKVCEELGNKAGIASTTCGIAVVFDDQGNYPKALEYYFKSLKMFEEIANKTGIAAITCNIGIVYERQSDYANALEYYFKGLRMDEEIGNKQYAANVTGNIGVVYEDQSDYAKGLEYYFKALKMHEEIGDKQGIACTIGSIGNIYRAQHNYIEAIVYHFKALKMGEGIGRHAAATYYTGIGDDYIGIAAYSGQAKVNNLVNDPEFVLSSAYDRQANLIPRGRSAILHKAIAYLDTAITIQKEIGDLNYLQQSYASLATADSLLSDYKGAYFAHMQYSFYKDSVFNKENAKKIVQQQMKRDYEAREDSIKLETVKKEKTAALQLQRQRSYTYASIAGILLLAAFAFFIARERRKSEQERITAEGERRKSDNLLLNILPAQVAQELKATGGVAAKQYDNVTVLFTDFVNFTQASEIMKPQELINELHTCFKAFDETAAKYHIEKIKTIGDAYLAVCGLPVANPKHGENIVSAALEINRYMQDRRAKLGSRTFEIRIGIHSGSVVAGIVGLKKFAYDIWGDTVNTAARMEQSSEAGKINISEITYELVKDKFNCEYRGEIDAKNKGMMKMYYVS